MANLDKFQELLAASERAELGPGPRPGVESQAALEKKLHARFAAAGLSPERQDLIRALVLLWHDHLETAHQIAQSLDNADGALVHGIMHRREPDYGNAAYWFRHTGRHGAYPELARRVTGLLETAGETALLKQLVPNGQWNAFAFVNACERVAGAHRNEHEQALLREVQQVETEVLLGWFCEGS